MDSPLRLTALILLLAGTASVAQVPAEEMLRGMVWQPPDEPRLVLADLQNMRAAGVEAVRIPFTEDPRVYGAADRVGMAVFVDLPVANLPAALLVDTLAFARRQLQALIELRASHPSIHGVGVATTIDTSDPRACGFIGRLAEEGRDAGLWVYYLTRFIEHDMCSAEVDAVLLDARGRPPGRLLARWARHQETPAGIGALGAEVRDGQSGGHLTPRSPASQARFLESALNELWTIRPQPPVVFVHRWRGPSFGLYATDGSSRMAAQVVSGFYTGRQTVFAIDAGPEPSAPPGSTSFMIIGWLAALMLIGLLSSAPRFRDLIPSYFARHNHYRESLQRSATLEGLAGVGGVLIVSLAAGVLMGVLLHALAQTDALIVTFAGLPAEQVEPVLDALQEPLVTVGAGTVLYALWMLINIVWLRALAGRRYRIRPLQAAVLAVLSRWQVVALSILALLAAQSDNTLAWLPWLIGAWALFEVYALVRMLYDYSHVSRVPMSRAIVTGVGVPLVVGVVLVAVAAIWLGPHLTFLWHLATRT